MTALIGTMIEPVMRNSSTSVAATTRSAANGRRSLSRALTSMSSAAMPPTSVSKAGGVPRSCGDERGCFAALGRAGGRDVDDGDARGRVGPDRGADDAGHVRRRSLEPGDELGAVGVGVGDDGDGVGAACREPVGEGERDGAHLG